MKRIADTKRKAGKETNIKRSFENDETESTNKDRRADDCLKPRARLQMMLRTAHRENLHGS